MARVSKRSLRSFTTRPPEPSTTAAPGSLLQPLPEELDEIDLRQDPGHLLAVLHDRDVVVVEDLTQARDGRVRGDEPLDRLHQRIHDLGEPVLSLDEEVQEVVLVDHAEGAP